MPEPIRIYGDSQAAQKWIATRVDQNAWPLSDLLDKRRIEIPVCQYNFFRLPQTIRFATELYGIALPDLPSALEVKSLSGLGELVKKQVEDLSGLLADSPIKLDYPALGLSELLDLLERQAQDGDEPNLLRLLGVVCNHVFIGPKTFHLDVSNLCNTDCVFCGLHSPHLFRKEGMRGRRFVEGWEKQQLPYELFIKLIEDLDRLGTHEDILLSGEGEPLTHPRIADMIREIKKRRMHLTLFTNGLLVDRRVINLLLESQLDVLYWSLSCATPETFVWMQPSKSAKTFERMIERLSLLCDRKRAEGKASPYVIMAHVINNLNYQETAEVAALAMKVGVDAIRYQIMHSVPATEQFLLSEKQYEQTLELVEQGKRLAQRSGIDVVANIDFQLSQVGQTYEQTGSVPDQWSRGLYNEIGCFTGWFFARNFTDGRISFCCHDKIMGNLNQTSLDDLWSSDRYQQVREVARDFETERNIDLTDGVCGDWLLGADCNVCGNYEFINQAQADLERTGLIRYLHRPAQPKKIIELFSPIPEVHDLVAWKPGSFNLTLNEAAGFDGLIGLQIDQRNFLILDRIAKKILDRLGEEISDLPVFEPRPTASIAMHWPEYLELLRTSLQSTRLRLETPKTDLDKLLSGIEDATKAEGENQALRLLGAATGMALTGPRWFIFEIINACNANCIYCNIHNPDRQPDPDWKRMRLSLEDFKQVAGDLAAIGGEGLTLLANGEPLLHPDFLSMMRFGREKGLDVGFFTNGTLLNKEIADEAVRLGVGEINVTVSAASGPVYARLHHTLDEKHLDRTLTNVRYLADQKRKANSEVPCLVMVNVVTSLNVHELGEMISVAAETGFNEVRFQMVRLDEFNRELALSENQLTDIRDQLPELEKLARQKGIVLWPGFAPQAQGVDDDSGDWERDRYIDHGCFVGYHLGLLKATGDFSFCCVVKPMGNIKDRSLAELWNSEFYLKMRWVAQELALRGHELLADGSPLLSDRCHRCDNHDVNRLAHEALTRYGLWPFVEARTPDKELVRQGNQADEEEQS